MPRRLVLAVLGAALLASGLHAIDARAPASAAVTHAHGFDGVVDGWHSWYGSYSMAALGLAWCVDHGASAPDPDLVYVPASLGVDANTEAAMAWASGRVGPAPDRIDSAALMLVLHDLMGARYPSGRLDVSTLPVARLSGFEGHEAAVLGRARALKADALAHRGLRGPLRLTVTVAAATVGKPATVTVRVLDAHGNGVSGLGVALAASGARLAVASVTTGTGGRATTTITPTAPTGEVRASATAPDLRLQAFAPTARAAQRVARPGTVPLRAERPFTARIPTGTVEIVKRGDAQPVFPVTGARFEIRPVASGPAVVATIGASGRAVVSVPVGEHRVVEVRPPAGYQAAGPWRIRVADGARTRLDVLDRVRRGGIRIRKIDDVTGAAVAGARFVLWRDADGNGSTETRVATVVSTLQPVMLSGLLPGDHRLVEVEVPAGYGEPAPPVAVRVEPGATAQLEVRNVPVATVAFRKQPGAGPRPAVVDLSGAVFVVGDAGGTEAGRCTTDATATCSLPPGALRGGGRYCWAEVVSPPGWGAAEGACFDAGGAGSITTIEVVEPSVHVPVTGRKVDAVAGTPLAGATYQLFRLRAAEHTLVAEATSAVDGTLDFGAHLPGFEYCAHEIHPPAGYALDPTPRCASVVEREAAHLELADRRASPTPTTPVTPPPPRPPTLHTPPSPPASMPPAAPPSLPATGASSIELAGAGVGLVLLGVALLPSVRSGRPRRGQARRPAGARRTRRWGRARS